MREILTVQIGGYANFVGSHFWNFQDELLGLAEDPSADPVFKNHECIDMDVLYRSGQTQRGILTCTPRLVSVDIKGSLGSMSCHGTLYNEELPSASVVDTWSGNVSTQTYEHHEKNLFLQSLDDEQNSLVEDKNASQRKYDDKDIIECLENGVRFWTDFSKVHYHPQSLYEITESGMNNEDFNNYGAGKDSLSVDLQGEEISERLRFFVEECDHIQGFQFVVDDSGGFSAVAADILENIADEYGNTPVCLYTVRGPESYIKPVNPKEKMLRGLHDAISFSRLSTYCKLVVPVGLPSLSTRKAAKFLAVKDEKRYHSSAVYAAAIHSMSLPFRMKHCGTHDFSSGAAYISEIIQMLSGQARKNMVGILDVAMPAPSLLNVKGSEQSLVSHLQTVTPETGDNTEDEYAVEAIATHGVYGSADCFASASEVEDSIHGSYSESRPKFCHVSVGRTPLPIPLPFPSIFRNQVGSRGELLLSDGSSLNGPLDVHSVPIASRLRSSTAILPYLENRLGYLRNYGMKRGSAGSELLRRSWGFGGDDLEELGESLSGMIMELKSSHDSDDDSE